MGISKSTQFDRFDRPSFIPHSGKSNKHQHSSSLHEDHNNSTANLREKHIPEYPPLIICKDSQCQTTQSSFSNRSKSSQSLYQHLFTMKTALVSLLAYLLFCLLVCFSKSFQSHLIYLNHANFPLSPLSDLTAYALPNARNIHFLTEDGLTIRGWHLLPPGPVSWTAASANPSLTNKDKYFNQQLSMAKLVIIQLHGNAGNRGVSRRIDLMKQLASEFSAHVVAVDYRGFGDSDGTPSEIGTTRDLFGLWRWLETIVGEREPGTAPPKIVIYSMSLGTGIAVNYLHHWTQQQRAMTIGPSNGLFVPISNYTPPLSLYPAGLILVSPFSSIADAIHDYPYAMVFRIIPFLFRFL
jgi:abhydrolase domain-containing protein 12